MAPVDASASASQEHGTEVPARLATSAVGVRMDEEARDGASLTSNVRLGPSARPRRQGPGDPSIRRTWWLLSGAFLILGSITGFRALTSRDLLDVLPVVVVAIAAVAAIGHRNAVAGLQARGRSEAESFARILRGLSRSVSADAVVTAIMDDLVDATGADHVVVVRRRQDGAALDATLLTRSAGVPATTTVLPIADLEYPADWRPSSPGVPVGPGIETEGATNEPRPDDASRPDAVPALELVSDDRRSLPAPSGTGAIPAGASRPFVRRADPPGRDAIPGPFTQPRRVLSFGTAAAAAPAVGATASATTMAEGGVLDWARIRRVAGAALSEMGALLRDLGVPAPGRLGGRAPAPVAEVLGSGYDAAIADRIAGRVRAVFGLAQTLTAPLRTDQGLIGAIVLSRRDREPWSDAERRILRGGASEAANALTRADSHRETEAQAATDPLTGLPNRRYFDEFCSLLARRRRAGDAVAILMIDIDKFKGLNDTYGHPVGDEVLKAVGRAIVSTVRDQDVPARVGGEEFAVLLRNPGPDVALEVGERVREAVRSMDLSAFGVGTVSVSVGVANALGPEEPLPDVVARADQALLRAKRAGRDRVVAA
jgi:diguanylate cyclase (GGDEF)-like protein